jgi:hypothetical protein
MKKGCLISNTTTGVKVENKLNKLLFTAYEWKGMLKLEASTFVFNPSWEVQSAYTPYRPCSLEAQHPTALQAAPRTLGQDAGENHITESAMALQSGVSAPASQATIETWHN